MAELTDLIAAHTLRVVELNEAARYPECNGCDWVGGLVKDHAAHVVAVLAETHAVIELPKPANASEAEWTGEWVDGIITAHIGKGKVRCYLEDPRMTSDDAREIGAGLIAAAAAADADASKISHYRNGTRP